MKRDGADHGIAQELLRCSRHGRIPLWCGGIGGPEPHDPEARTGM